MAPPQDDRGSCDEDVAAAAQACLQQSPRFVQCRISCRFRQGTLILEGRVPSHSLRHAAQSLVERIEGVRQIDNRLEIMPFPSPHEPGSSARTLLPDEEGSSD